MLRPPETRESLDLGEALDRLNVGDRSVVEGEDPPDSPRPSVSDCECFER